MSARTGGEILDSLRDHFRSHEAMMAAIQAEMRKAGLGMIPAAESLLAKLERTGDDAAAA